MLLHEPGPLFVHELVWAGFSFACDRVRISVHGASRRVDKVPLRSLLA